MNRRQDSNRVAVPRQRREPMDESSRTDNVVVAAVVLVCLAAPLAYLPGALNRFHDIKLFVITIAVTTGILQLLRSGTLRVPSVSRWGYLVLLTLAGSAVVNGLGRTTLLGYATRHAGLWMWLLSAGALVLGASLDDGARELARRSLVAAGTVTSAIVVLQVAGVPILRPPDSDTRPTATFGSAAFSGAFVAIALVVLVASFTDVRSESTDRRSEQRASLLTIGQLVLFVAGLGLTGARAAWVGAAVGLLVLVLGLRTASTPSIGLGRPQLLTVAGAVVVGAAVAGFVPSIRERLTAATNLASGTVSGRIELWRGLPATIRERPIIGWGPDSTRIGYPQNLPLDFERRFGVETIPDRAHTFLGDIAIWAGIAGALAVFGFLVVAMTALVRRVRDHSEATSAVDRRWAAVAIGALSAYVAHLLFNFDTVELDPVVLLIVGAGLGGTARVQNAARRKLSLAVAVPVGMALSLIAAGLVLADWSAGRAVDAERAGTVGAAQVWWRRAQVFSLSDSYYHEALARLAARQGDWAGAIAASRRADRGGDPYRHELWLDMRLEEITNTGLKSGPELDQLQAEYQEMADGWPGHASLFNSLGVVAVLQGDRTAAVAHFERAVELLPTDESFQANLERARALADG